MAACSIGFVLPETRDVEPAKIGRYRIAGKIGAGGMGVVYRGVHSETSEVVAIKTTLVPQEGQIAGLRREIHALRRLSHPGVVKILDEGLEQGLPWYAMELLEGETIADFLDSLWNTAAPQRGADDATTRAMQAESGERTVEFVPAWYSAGLSSVRLERRRAAAGQLHMLLTTVRRLCETLSFLHGEGIVHRDLKPANLFLRAGALPVIMDFGLARHFSGAGGREVLDISGCLLGTPPYMAPEQFRGELVDARADLYAVGCILHECVTGVAPFSESQSSFLRKLQELPPPASSWVDGVPTALDELILRLLTPRPRDRIGHASDVARALGELGATTSPYAPRPARAYVYRPELTGRDAALQELKAHFDRLKRGRGSCLLVRGESGIGKTYLAMSFASSASLHQVRVIPGSCAAALGQAASASEGAGAASGRTANESPLHPFRALFEALADQCISRDEAFTDLVLGERGKVLAACHPALARLPGQDTYPDPPELPAQAARERLLGALGATLGAIGFDRPTMLILDDLQWADELSLEFLASLPDDYFEQYQVMILCTYRSEEKSAALSKIEARRYASRIEVGRLDMDAVTMMIGDMLALPDPPRAFSRFVAESSDGNPFFVAEYVRAAVAEGFLSRTTSGMWRLNDPPASEGSYERLSLPRSLNDLISHRLAGLGGAALALVEVASVIGRESDIELLARVAELPEYTFMEAVQELIARQVLEEADAGRVRFLHDKIRETTYARVSLPRRRRLHLLVARTIEARHAGTMTLPQLYAALSLHYTQAGDTPKAIEYLEKAGEQALKNFANREAVGFFRSLLALAEERSPAADGVGDALRLIRWERRLATAYFCLGDLSSAIRHASHALDRLDLTLPRSSWGWTLDLLKQVPVQLAHRMAPGSVIARSEEARARYAEAASAMQIIAECFYFRGAVPTIIACVASVNLSERAHGDGGICRPYAALGGAMGLSKLPRVARRYFGLAHATADRTQDLQGLVYSLQVEMAWLLGEGRWGAVRELNQRAAELAARLGSRREIEIVQSLAAHVAYFTGRFHESRALCEAVIRSARERGDDQQIGWGLGGAARSALPLGAFQDARRLLEEALAIENVEIVVKVDCPGLLAQACLREGDLARATEMAELTATRVRQNLPFMFFMAVAGCAGAAEVYVARWEQERRWGARLGGELRAKAWRAVRDLFTLSLGVRIAWPHYHRLRGRLLWAEGARRRARDAWRRALRAASALHTPYEEALAHLELARVEPRGALARGAHLEQAERLFSEMQCPSELAEIRALRA